MHIDIKPLESDPYTYAETEIDGYPGYHIYRHSKAMADGDPYITQPHGSFGLFMTIDSDTEYAIRVEIDRKFRSDSLIYVQCKNYNNTFIFSSENSIDCGVNYIGSSGNMFGRHHSPPTENWEYWIKSTEPITYRFDGYRFRKKFGRYGGLKISIIRKK